MLADLLYFLGPDRLLFGSDYGITSPKWIIEKFMAFEFPDDLAREARTPLTLAVKRKILGLNAAKLAPKKAEEFRKGAEANFEAAEADYKKATQRVYRTRELPSHVTVLVVP